MRPPPPSPARHGRQAAPGADVEEIRPFQGTSVKRPLGEQINEQLKRRLKEYYAERERLSPRPQEGVGLRRAICQIWLVGKTHFGLESSPRFRRAKRRHAWTLNRHVCFGSGAEVPMTLRQCLQMGVKQR